VRRAGRRQAFVGFLALAVVVLLTLFTGATRGAAAGPAPVGTNVAGHVHHPQADPLRPSERNLEQHLRTVPAGMAGTTAVAVVLLPAGPVDAGARSLGAATTRPRSRAPPR
jgi:hypothetical protein